MPIAPRAGSFAADPDEQIDLSSLFSVTASAGDPTYLIVTGLDRDEYSAGYDISAMGWLSSDDVSQKFANFSGDAWSVGVVFTYDAATGLYENPTYGGFDQLVFTASSNTDDNVSLSVFTTNNERLATAYATDPYMLIENPTYFSYAGSVNVVTQPSEAGATPAQATPQSVCAAAMSFVGKAWNENGCWVLASDISADAGASLPLTSALVGLAGVANGEWVVAYNGPTRASSDWESQLVAGEMVAFETSSGSGHITTVVSGSGSSVMLVDNITYLDQNGSITNPADDGSTDDVVIDAPHAATQEFAGVDPGMVVVYELDTPTVSDAAPAATVAEDTDLPLAPLFTASNPVAGQPMTEWQIYDSNGNDSIAVDGVAISAHSAADAVTAGSLASVALDAGNSAGSDEIEVRAFNGSYWGDWQSLTVTVSPTPPVLSRQTPSQVWTEGQPVSLALSPGTFTDPQGETLSYAATQADGAALPGWLSFDAATETFSGTAPASAQSLSLSVTATDTSGLSSSETFAASIEPVAPGSMSGITVADPTPNQTWVAGQDVAFVLASDTFMDSMGERMAFTASEASGANVTAWLHFDSVAGESFGDVPSGASGTVTLEVIARDASRAMAVDLFHVTLAAGVAGASPGGSAAGSTLPDMLTLLHLPGHL